MANADVVVSIVSHSNRDLVLRCLDALERSRGSRYTQEVVVLDNASRDGSVEAIREQFPRVSVIAQGRRCGFGANHNSVIAATRSRYLLLLNDDAVVEEGLLDQLVEYLEERLPVAAVAPRIVSPDGQPQQTAWRSPTPMGCLLFALTLGRVGWVQSTGRDPRPVGWASGCALLVRRDALEHVGGFDERFFMYAEDTDLCRRLSDAGYEIHFLPSAHVTHFSQSSTAEVPVQRTNEQWRSLGLYWTKHHGRAAALARLFMGVGLLLKACAAVIVVATDRRHAGGRRWTPLEFWDGARYALFGVRGPGLRELADAWNRAAVTQSENATVDARRRCEALP